jgi:hypothetical protein
VALLGITAEGDNRLTRKALPDMETGINCENEILFGRPVQNEIPVKREPLYCHPVKLADGVIHGFIREDCVLGLDRRMYPVEECKALNGTLQAMNQFHLSTELLMFPESNAV